MTSFKNISNSIFGTFGFVTANVDGVVAVQGLNRVQYGELVVFHLGVKSELGLVLNLSSDLVSVVILGDEFEIIPGTRVSITNQLMSVPVGKELLGRVIDPIGNLIDGGLDVIFNEFRRVESIAPSIISRAPVSTPLETGIKVIDSTVPIGLGQRELIIGDSKTGKTSIAIDTIINQKGTDLICIYVAIGQKRSSVARIYKTLEKQGCLTNTIIVAATSSDSAALQYVAPYSGCTIGEYFMERGLDVLCIYDDLSKQAVAYRQISLLLRRPPGREGFPGDVFYTHSRLLERAANLAGDKGSLTALPIIETIQGDVSAYVPTNVISITDGQIFLEKELFSRGIRPAVSPGISVSRVGSAAQSKSIKKLASSLKLELAQFREVEDFARLGFTLDEATTLLIEKGTKLTAAMSQKAAKPVNVSLQILFLYALLNSFLNVIPLSSLDHFEKELYNFILGSSYYLPLNSFIRDNLFEGLLNYILMHFIDGYVTTYLSSKSI